MIEVLLGSGVSLPAVSVDDELAGALQMAGFDPGELNAIRWRTGATRWSSVRLLLTKADADALFEALGPPATAPQVPMTLVISRPPAAPALVLDRVFFCPPRHRHVGLSGMALEMVEFVDERWHWQRHGFNPGSPPRGFNVTTDDKGVHYASTVQLGDTPFTFREALQVMFGALPPGSGPGDFDVPAALARLDTSVGLSDLTVEGNPVGELIHRVLVASGHALLAYPSVASSPTGSRYRVVAFESGDAAAAAMMSAHGELVVAGGLWGGLDSPVGGGGGGLPGFEPPSGPPIGGGGGPPTVTQTAIGVSEHVGRYVPSQIEVKFPSAVRVPSGYTFDPALDLEGASYVTRRWHAVVTAAGRPAFTGGNGETLTLYDASWARFEVTGGGPPVIQNQAELDARAEAVGAIYYARFRSGLADVGFAGFVPPAAVIYSGSHLVEWIIGTHGPEGPLQAGIWTRVIGDWNDSSFGWDHSRPVTPTGALSIGTVRAMPRPEGGVLLDSPLLGAGTGKVHPARITAINGTPPNATYDAVAEDAPTVAVQDEVPLNRSIFDQVIIDFSPFPGQVRDPNDPVTTPGDRCLIVEYADGNALIYFERVGVVSCTPGGAPSGVSARMAADLALAAHGLL